jgi:hypothetical protein
LGKITPGKTQCGKTNPSICGFYYAAENIEISYRADRFTTMVEETSAKILPSTCMALSKPNRTQQHKIGPANKPLRKSYGPVALSLSHTCGSLRSVAQPLQNTQEESRSTGKNSPLSSLQFTSSKPSSNLLLYLQITLSQVHNAPIHQVDFLLSQ